MWTATVWRVVPTVRRPAGRERPIECLALHGRPADRVLPGDTLRDCIGQDALGGTYEVPRALVVSVAPDGLVEAVSSGAYYVTHSLPSQPDLCKMSPADEPQIVAEPIVVDPKEDQE